MGGIQIQSRCRFVSQAGDYGKKQRETTETCPKYKSVEHRVGVSINDERTNAVLLFLLTPFLWSVARAAQSRYQSSLVGFCGFYSRRVGCNRELKNGGKSPRYDGGIPNRPIRPRMALITPLTINNTIASYP